MTPTAGKTTSFFLVLLAVALTFWWGPRPVVEPWVAEVLSPSASRGPLGDGLSDALSPGGDLQLVRELANLNGISPERLPHISEGAQLFDADNDGDLDLFLPRPPVASEKARGRKPSTFQFHLGGGDGFFREVSSLMGAAFVDPGCSLSPNSSVRTRSLDLDRDGKVDLAVELEGGSWLVLRNRLSQRNYLLLHLEATTNASKSSKDCGKVALYVDGRKQVRWAAFRGASGSTKQVEVHFGLGDAAVVDRVEVHWPSGHTTELHEVAANGVVRVVEGQEMEESS